MAKSRSGLGRDFYSLLDDNILAGEIQLCAIAYGMERMLIMCSTYFLCGLMDVFCGALRALDRSVTAMVISLCCWKPAM